MKSIFKLIIFLNAGILCAQGPFNCTAEAYLFQYNDIYSIDLASGQAVLEIEDITPGNINAAAYNPADGYIWGSLSSPAEDIVRIGQGMSVDSYNVPGKPAAYVGAISSSGQYYLKAGGAEFKVIDLDPASSDYLNIVQTQTLDQNISIADWAFNSVDGALYTVTIGTNQLCRIDPNTAAVTLLGEVPVLSGLSYTYGAVYFDVDGNFYVSANQTGTIYIVKAVQDVTTGGIIDSNLFAYGPASASNDGARCPTAPVPQEICDNGIDDDGDGLVDCDDPSCSGVSNCPTLTTSGGNNGGLESNNRMSELITKRNYNRAIQPTAATQGNPLAAYTAKNAVQQRSMNLSLTDLVPVGILEEVEALESSPDDLINITNATEVFSVDYRNETGNMASILALKTEDGVYEHSKFICDRLLGAELNSVSKIYLKDQEFIKSIVYRPDGKREFVLSFAMRRRGDGAVIESHWNIDGYTLGEDYYNFQIWTSNIDDLITLAEGILELIEVQLPIEEYEMTSPPYVFVQRARIDDGKLVMQLMNNDFSKELRIEGGMRRTETESFEQVSYQVDLDSYKNMITLDLGSFFDFGMRLSTETANIPDDLFVSEGPWGYDDSAASTSVTSYEVTRSETEESRDSYPINRGIILAAESMEYVAVYRALTPRFEAVDLSEMNLMTFRAAGEGTMEITLVKHSAEKWEDQLHATVQLRQEKDEIILKKSDFRNHEGVDANWSDIKMLVFTKRSESGEMETLRIEVSDIAFSIQDLSSSHDILTDEDPFIYPNPANDILSINLSSAESDSQISVYDAKGKVQLSQLLSASESASVNISTLVAGTYTVTIMAGDRLRTEKLVVLR